MKRVFMRRPALSLLWLSLVVWGCDGQREVQVDEQAADLISLHWPASQPAPDSRMCAIVGTGEEIALDPNPIIGLEHIAEAYVASERDNFVTIRLTGPGRATLAESTARRIGDNLAVVVDDRVLAMPLIQSSLDVPEIALMPQQSREEVDDLAARINEAIAAQGRQ